MSFVCPINHFRRFGLVDAANIFVPLSVPTRIDLNEPYPFIFDTGCEITMVSEDVAALLGLPPDDGSRRTRVTGSTGMSGGRLVDVSFRFPTTVSGTPGLEVSSTWVVVTGPTDLALLGFQEVHRYFSVKTYEFDVYFIPWRTLAGR